MLFVQNSKFNTDIILQEPIQYIYLYISSQIIVHRCPSIVHRIQLTTTASAHQFCVCKCNVNLNPLILQIIVLCLCVYNSNHRCGKTYLNLNVDEYLEVFESVQVQYYCSWQCCTM